MRPPRQHSFGSSPTDSRACRHGAGADDIGIWQELAHLRTEDFQWRECVRDILGDVGRHVCIANQTI